MLYWNCNLKRSANQYGGERMITKYPSKEIAEKELQIAGRLNPGPWVEHSQNTGVACRSIAQRCLNLDADKAYILGIVSVNASSNLIVCKYCSEM
jgi:hypothetical protein